DTGIAGNINMLGPPAPTTSIDVNAYAGPYGNYKSLATAPGSFLIFPMVGSDAFGLGCPGVPYRMQATIDLGSFNSYEYFASPILSPVHAECGYTNNLTNVFVMCPTNPGIVRGTVSLCGPVDTNYYGGYPALQALQFATYDANGLPLDPITGTPSDPT